MEKNPALQAYDAIGEEIEKYQAEIDDFEKMALYADAKDSPALKRHADQRRDVVLGLERARSIAFRIAIGEEPAA